MPAVSTADLIARARANGTAIAAFNVITLEHAQAIAAAAERVQQPAILQISQNAVHYHCGCLHAIAAGTVEVARRSAAHLALHLDHAQDIDLVRQAASAGFSSVMFDAGALPLEENVAATRAAVRVARADRLFVEAELGHVGGKDEIVRSAHDAGVRTDPGKAGRFVAETGVDALAVAVGTSHAMTQRSAALDHDLIHALREAVPVPLVLHGSSGLPDAELRGAVAAGIVKINIGTVLNIAFTTAVRAALAEPMLTDPRKYLAPARDAMADVVAELLTVIATTPARSGDPAASRHDAANAQIVAENDEIRILADLDGSASRGYAQ